MNGSYSGGDGVLEEEQDLGVVRTSKGKETDRLQVGVQKGGGSIRKGRRTVQSKIGSKGIFTKTWD